MSTATKRTTSRINWKAAERVAERLGVHTRELVAAHDADAVFEWALRMARDWTTGSFNEPRAASYLELAALVGHHDEQEEGDPDE
jgi:hypothetical protein